MEAPSSADVGVTDTPRNAYVAEEEWDRWCRDFREAVGLFTDGIEADFLDGHFGRSVDAVNRAVDRNATVCGWVASPDLAWVTLTVSAFADAALAATVPYARRAAAARAFSAEVVADLEGRRWYRDLPV